MTTSQLLLTAERLAQFEAALGAGGLEAILERSEKFVAQYTRGYVVEPEVIEKYVSVVTLYDAHLTAEGAVPEDLKEAYDKVLAQLEDIRDGKSTLPTAEGEISATVASGGWGSQTRLAMRGDPTT